MEEEMDELVRSNGKSKTDGAQVSYSHLKLVEFWLIKHLRT